MATARMMVQEQAIGRITKAEQRYAAAITALESFFDQYGICGRPLARQQLEREYKASQRALRAARTFYSTLANQYGWTLP